MNISVKIVILLLLTLTGCTDTMPKSEANAIGINDGHLNDCPNSPNCVSSQAQDAEHAIQAIDFSGTPAEAKARIVSIINDIKRTKIVVADDNYIHAEFTSMIFRFVDDVEFHFPNTEANKTSIEVRSASRTGRSDFGVNRKRVEEFRNQLQ